MQRRVLRSLFCFPNKILGIILLAYSLSFSGAVHGQELEPASQEMSKRIDELLEERLKELGWKPADPSTDAAFRRVHLDLTGSPPTGSEVLGFERDESESKDKKLIDRLLGTASCANHFAGQ